MSKAKQTQNTNEIAEAKISRVRKATKLVGVLNGEEGQHIASVKVKFADEDEHSLHLQIPSENQLHAGLMAHGVAALVDKVVNGANDVEGARKGVHELIAELEKGNVPEHRSRGEKAVPVIVEAISRHRNVSVEDAQKWYDSCDRAKRIKLAHGLRGIVKEIEEERAKASGKKVENKVTEDLFSGL